MRRRREDMLKDEDTEINMTPMLDIVFIMLIFFIVTTSFTRESGISVQRPKAETTEQRQKKNIIIGIQATGEVWIDKRATDIRAVRANVERIRAESPVEAVLIEADRKTTTDILVRVMDQVRLAGIQNVSLATEAEGR
jgi:biopolymer transport protein ExbD